MTYYEKFRGGNHIKDLVNYSVLERNEQNKQRIVESVRGLGYIYS